MNVQNKHENVVNENEWGDLECLQKPTETDIETGGGLFSDTSSKKRREHE